MPSRAACSANWWFCSLYVERENLSAADRATRSESRSAGYGELYRRSSLASTRPSAIAGKRFLAIHERAGGHFDIQPAIGRGNAIISGHPVRHHDAIEAPFLAGDLRVEVPILRGVLAVDQVVGIHDGAHMRLLHRRFE